MSQQLVVGKYKFYPYEQPKAERLSPDELAELCVKFRAKRTRSKTSHPRKRESKE